MIADWDLWPWMIADQAGGMVGVVAYRLERRFNAVALTIGRALLPAITALSRAVKS
jgi:hypothetical protein